MVLDYLEIEDLFYEVLEGSDYHLSEKKHDYYDVGYKTADIGCI